MIQNILNTLGGIENYGVASLCLFVVIFVGVLVWAGVQRQAHLDAMSRLPLEPEEPNHGETPDE